MDGEGLALENGAIARAGIPALVDPEPAEIDAAAVWAVDKVPMVGALAAY